jgi:hypothetical protein
MTDYVITFFTESRQWFMFWATQTLNHFSLRFISLNLYFIASSTASQTVGVNDDIFYELEGLGRMRSLLNRGTTQTFSWENDQNNENHVATAVFRPVLEPSTSRAQVWSLPAAPT